MKRRGSTPCDGSRSAARRGCCCRSSRTPVEQDLSERCPSRFVVARAVADDDASSLIRASDPEIGRAHV